jgi:hypothetical protein
MKNLLNFADFVYESQINEAKPYTLDKEEKNWESPELLTWALSTLGAKNSKEACILDEDEPTDPKAYNNIAKKVTDWVKNEEFSGYDEWYYSASSNVLKFDSGGYIVYYCLVKDLKKF